jgi:hypothetical protein
MSEENREEIAKNNKKIIFKVLKSLKIKEVFVHYSGYGDSGQIDDLTFHRSSKKPIKIKTLTHGLVISGLKHCTGGYTVNPGGVFGFTRSYEDRPPTSDLEEVIKDLCYDLLEERHGGWEINSGSNGHFHFVIPENTIRWDHHDIIESTETSSHII